MSEVNSKYEIEYLEKSDWKEVNMVKALKMWANNSCHVKCTVGDYHYYFYHGQESIRKLDKIQITEGKWYISYLK